MMNNLKRILCIVLSVFLVSAALISCADRVKDPVLEYEGEKISLSMYEFMLSRMKGTLARNKYDVTPLSTFWDEKHPGSELTNEEYYNRSILDNCKNYLASLVIFEEEGLSLSKSVLADIEEEISFYIDYDCGGDEGKLDILLSKYGTDAEGLRKIYEIEAKYQAVIAYLYGQDGSLIADNVKEEYYRENYYRFKQILISNFYYEYQEDKEGNIIYFDPESGKPVYDDDGEYKYDDKENRIVDSYGIAIRYDKDGKILYDKEKGVPAPTTDKNGNAIEHKYSKEEMEERTAAIEGIINAASNGNFSAFEAEMSKWEVYEGAGEYYKDGYYLSELESGGYDENLSEILASLKEMKVGEAKLIESESGYHIIMKYELDSGKFSDSEYAEWFSSFDQSLINKLFLDRCAKFYSNIEVNEKSLEKARSIKNIGTNYDY